MSQTNDLVSYDEFAKIDIRSGTVIKAEHFKRARNPSYKVWVDFGELYGVKQTSAQITVHYEPNSLIGKQVVGILNLGTKNIAGFESQFLLVGFSDKNGDISLLTSDIKVPNGQRMH